MEHLPLIHVRELGLFFESFMDFETSRSDSFIEGLGLACKAMQFERLKSIHLAFNFDVYCLPVLDLWVRSGFAGWLVFADQKTIEDAGNDGANGRNGTRIYEGRRDLLQAPTDLR
jgi:hypothetical protein